MDEEFEGGREPGQRIDHQLGFSVRRVSSFVCSSSYGTPSGFVFLAVVHQHPKHVEVLSVCK